MINKLIRHLCSCLSSLLWFLRLILLMDFLITSLEEVILVLLANQSASAGADLILVQVTFVLLGEEASDWMLC